MCTICQRWRLKKNFHAVAKNNSTQERLAEATRAVLDKTATLKQTFMVKRQEKLPEYQIASTCIHTRPRSRCWECVSPEDAIQRGWLCSHCRIKATKNGICYSCAASITGSPNLRIEVVFREALNVLMPGIYILVSILYTRDVSSYSYVFQELGLFPMYDVPGKITFAKLISAAPQTVKSKIMAKFLTRHL